MAVSDRVQEALVKIKKHDIDNALIQLSIAIDATAKKMYPHRKNAQRIKGFLQAKRSFIWWCLLNGIPNANGEFCLSFANKGYVPIEDIMYKYIRCSVLHEGKIPDNITFSYVEYIRVNADGSLILPVAYLQAVLWAVICSTENKGEKMTCDYFCCFGKEKVNLNDFWGDEVGIRKAIRNGFEYDCEAILEELEKQTFK